MTPRDLLRRTAVRFRAAGIPDPETDGPLLLSSLCGRPPLNLRLDTETVLADAVLRAFESLVSRRLQRIPLQYLLSEAPFCGRMFHVDERVLIPRPETELLCEWALDILKGFTSPRILDLCCGSGCIGLTLQAERPDASVTLSDCSESALSVVADNAQRLGIRVDLRRGDLTDGIPADSFDLIICNPPYIPSGECKNLQPEVLREPLLALDGGPDGLSLYRRLIPGASCVLRNRGCLLLEVGIGEAPAVARILMDNHFHSVEIRRDPAGIERMVLAVR